MGHSAKTIVITCIDFRFQKYINDWISKHFELGTFDRGAFAGAAKGLDTILTQVGVAHRLHHIKKAVIVNHEDCGAYEPEGHFDHHVRDLKEVRKQILLQFPNLDIKTYYLHLDGTFEAIS